MSHIRWSYQYLKHWQEYYTNEQKVTSIARQMRSLFRLFSLSGWGFSDSPSHHRWDTKTTNFSPLILSTSITNVLASLLLGILSNCLKSSKRKRSMGVSSFSRNCFTANGSSCVWCTRVLKLFKLNEMGLKVLDYLFFKCGIITISFGIANGEPLQRISKRLWYKFSHDWLIRTYTLWW